VITVDTTFGTVKLLVEGINPLGNITLDNASHKASGPDRLSGCGMFKGEIMP
jgi:hypothetical protein